eukprot:scaffold12087_cov73-Skeletonema_dohrnii-CCMP3373.AAC.1
MEVGGGRRSKRQTLAERLGRHHVIEQGIMQRHGSGLTSCGRLLAAEKDGRDDFSESNSNRHGSLFLMEFQSEVTLLFILTTDVLYPSIDFHEKESN